jgi:protein arginine N-methyltransferase 5
MAAASSEKRSFAVAAATSVSRPNRPKTDPWQAWNTLRTLTGFSAQVSVCLELTAALPPPEEQRRWLGEPIRAVIVPTHVFKRNKLGFSVLPRPHQAFLTRLMQQRAQIIISGRPQPLAGGNGIFSANYSPYLEYFRHLASKIPGSSDREDFEEPYHDYLQAPLQPLMDNLESSTYETFEKDPVKYQLYEEAVRRALLDTPEDKVSLVMVVGAGRGPLVRRSLKAAEAAGRRIRMYAVEKNPNAVITLRNLVAEKGWGDLVQVVSHDMRTWEAPEKADILVSELLGSFGDNELSPECLDGAQKFLKDDGISIPASYTSLAAPVMSSKLWNEVRSYKEDKSFETGYVVKMHNFAQLDEPQPCHTFEHPNRAAGPIDNTRYSVNRFVAGSAAAVHGFGGYFECVLYKDVVMSINPATHSEGMFSWFPIFFPIKAPFYVSKGDVIELHVWRRVSSSKVWYEWAYTAPDVTEIHNPGGRSYWIGL